MTLALPSPQAEFNPKKVSPSRLNNYVSCGVSFHMNYLQRLPSERSGSAALFGTVMHKALELWGLDRTRDLTQLVRDAWITETVWNEKPTAVTQFIKEYQPLSIKVIHAEHAARTKWEADPRNKGKKSQAPRMTKYFKESDAAKELNRMLGRWWDTLNSESPWQFSERDPLPSLYDESLVLSKRYAHSWGHLPTIWQSELKVTEEWRGFLLDLRIDVFEPLIDKDTKELVGLGVTDYKTYRKEPAPMKDWRQVTMYDAAVRQLLERDVVPLPVDWRTLPLYIGIDYVRGAGVWDKPRQYWQVTAEDHDRLERELRAYENGVTNGVFLPAEKGRNPDFCDYGDACCLRSTSAAGGSAQPVEVNL